MVKNPPSSARGAVSIPGLGTKNSHAMGQLSLHTAAREPTFSAAHVPQLEKPLCRNEEKTQHSQKKKKLRKKPKISRTVMRKDWLYNNL